jgi:UDP-N-acetylglucosamine 2-epimerase (non-hydrolysing)
MKFLSVVGTRPNFMKLAPLARALAEREVRHVIVHTGQHYDLTMSDAFFEDLDLPEPDHHLAVGSGSHAAQTAAVLARLEPIIAAERPDIVLVYGDVNSTVAAALAAAKMNVRVAHIEAGLRSRDRSMPEELNRLVTDQLSDLLFAPSVDAADNLRAEGIPSSRIRFVGNVMIDSLTQMLPRARAEDVPARYGLDEDQYVVVTLHRPSNVDDPDNLAEVVRALEKISRERAVLFPVHPRTRHRLSELEIHPNGGGDLRLLEPLGYTEMLGLVSGASLVITDSGGLQEETTFLGIPCLTVRPNTERPVTCTRGTNRLVPADEEVIVHSARRTLSRNRAPKPMIELWDGKAAERIARELCEYAAANSATSGSETYQATV